MMLSRDGQGRAASLAAVKVPELSRSSRADAPGFFLSGPRGLFAVFDILLSH
jgi:hypothetical protein